MEPETNKELGDGRSGTRTWAVAAGACLLLVGLGGAALLVWWALAFHPSDEQLWMVPVGLILLGTPVVAWLSVGADLCRRF
ncbi:hypothetical protein COCNU_07G007650 [Cocos nucifera]|uniref:Uncharacterized protein n=1 Tax=Cocos nucifera TaxID=13894 RepID=A0A8K0N4W3_COCNU|nr:hypothetical protein COCNU_07G007640 [Cocos nucifera]KAG1354653.1 hypothetical protein COCNU_07G007650 [Cocos nucifera]